MLRCGRHRALWSTLSGVCDTLGVELECPYFVETPVPYDHRR